MTRTSVLGRSLFALTATVALALAGCTTASGQSGASDQSGQSGASASGSFFSMDTVHTVSVTFDDADYQAMLDTYSQTGDKDWIKATVTIDGNTFEEVGLRLKGNSSLRGLRTGGDAQSGGDAGQFQWDTDDGQVDVDNPQTMPWLIRLDKYVDGQSYSGRTDFVVRGNTSQTSLNEALAVALLSEANVPTQEAAFARFSVNGGDEKLRLIVDVPDDSLWNEDEFGGTGYTYKAESGADYSYLGDDPDAYADAFEQKFGEDDMTPLIDFLDFINNSSDEDFASKLQDYLDVDGFASYLAMQDLIGNTDDIDGPGNNSYLHYDPTSGKMTVVSWDHNLAFGGMGGMGGMGGGQGGFPDGQMPEGAMSGADGGWPGGGFPGGGAGGPGGAGGGAPDGMQSGEMPDGFPGGGMPEGRDRNMPDGGMQGGMSSINNALTTRFKANSTFSALIDQKTAEFKESLFDSGKAETLLQQYTQLLTDQASDLVPADTIEQESQSIQFFLSGNAGTVGGQGGFPGGQMPQRSDGQTQSNQEQPQSA